MASHHHQPPAPHPEKVGHHAVGGKRGTVCHERPSIDAGLLHLPHRLGFTMRLRGSHHVFNRRGLTSPINLQDIAGSAKEYQVRQVRRILLEQGLTSITGDRNDD